MKIEYRVRPVTRYVVTRWYQTETEGGCETRGEFDHADTAYEVGYALCKMEHEQHGWPAGDERIIYPRHPREYIPGTNSADINTVKPY